MLVTIFFFLFSTKFSVLLEVENACYHFSFSFSTKLSALLEISPSNAAKFTLLFAHDFDLTHYQTTNFRLFQTERVCRRQFQIGRKWKTVIQTGRKAVGKGEIARYEQFLLFPQCFQKACFPGASKGVIVWEWVKQVKRTLSFGRVKNMSFLSSRKKLCW